MARHGIVMIFSKWIRLEELHEVRSFSIQERLTSLMPSSTAHDMTLMQRTHGTHHPACTQGLVHSHLRQSNCTLVHHTKHKRSTYAPGGYEHALFQSLRTRLNIAAQADIIESTEEALRSAPGLVGWRDKTANPSVVHHQTTDSKHMPLPAACTTIGSWSSVDSRDADYVCPRKPPFKSTRPSHRKPESALDGKDVAPALLQRQSGETHLASASQIKCLTSTSFTRRSSTAHDMSFMVRTTRHALKVWRKITCDSHISPQASATKLKLQSTYAPGGYEYALFRSAPTRRRGLNTAAAADIIESTEEALRSAPGRGKTANPSVAHHHMTDSKHMPLPAACTDRQLVLCRQP